MQNAVARRGAAEKKIPYLPRILGGDYGRRMKKNKPALFPRLKWACPYKTSKAPPKGEAERLKAQDVRISFPD
jgi:hypothetical protein